MFSLLTDFAAELRYDRAVKAVILTGAGRAFTAGRDVKGGDKEPPMHFADAEAFMHDTIKALEALPIPLIAAVNGPCFTGGLELVLAADIIIAARSATFCDTHAELGIVPGWGLSVRLPRRVGYAAAKLMSWTARRYSGEQAADIGLADLVVDDDALMTTAAVRRFSLSLSLSLSLCDRPAGTGTLEKPVVKISFCFSGARDRYCEELLGKHRQAEEDAELRQIDHGA